MFCILARTKHHKCFSLLLLLNIAIDKYKHSLDTLRKVSAKNVHLPGYDFLFFIMSQAKHQK